MTAILINLDSDDGTQTCLKTTPDCTVRLPIYRDFGLQGKKKDLASPEVLGKKELDGIKRPDVKS